MIDFRKLLVTLVIAILFAILVHTTIEAFAPSPVYSDYCPETYNAKVPPKYYDQQNLTAEEQQQIEAYDQKMKECSDANQKAWDHHNFVQFVISAVAGLIAIIAGLYISTSTGLGMSVASGFILGGLFAIFFGTMESWGSFGAKIKPLIILLELVLVIFVAYKRLNDRKEHKKE